MTHGIEDAARGRRNSYTGWIALAVVGAMLEGTGAWAQDQSAAIDRLLDPQKVLVEIFHMEGVPRLETEQIIDGKPVSLAGLFATGGLQLEVVYRQESVPRVADFSGDYTSLARTVEALRPPPVDKRWYVAILVADSNPQDILALLPDSGGQTAILFAEEHSKFGSDAALAMFHSAAHELTHLFHLHHNDWEGTSFYRDSTIEGYSRPETVRWHLSAASIEHLRHAPDEYVRPGGVPFEVVLPAHAARHQSTPAEYFEFTGKRPEVNSSNPPTLPSTPSDVHALGPIIIFLSESEEQEEQTTTRARIRVTLKVAKVGAPLQEILVNVESATGKREIRRITAPNPDEQSVNLGAVKLDIGNNTIVVEAADKGGRRATGKFQITREEVRGKLIAVVFGVQGYKRVPPLKHSLDDARGIRDALTRLGVEESRLFYQEDPDITTLRRGIGWLRRNASEKDVAVVYFAGHGAVEGDAEVEERDHLAKYLLPSDADLSDLYATALPMVEVRDLLGQVKAGTVLVILDSCFSGAAGEDGRTVAADAIRAAALDPNFLGRGVKSGHVILSASGANETAREYEDLKHGVFTYYLLEGLSGKADTNNDHSVDLLELFGWVRNQVKDRTQNKQVPLIYGETRDEFPLWQASP